MDQLETITALIQPVLDSFQVQLYELKWIKEGKDRILQASVMFNDGTMDIDTCASISEKLSELLDQLEDLEQEYFLEVCSPGAERELKSWADIEKALGSHVFVQLKAPVKTLSEVTGDLIRIEGRECTVEYRDKAAVRKVSFNDDNIARIRLAVKL